MPRGVVTAYRDQVKDHTDPGHAARRHLGGPLRSGHLRRHRRDRALHVLGAPGALPTGLTLSSGGVLAGTPTDKTQIGDVFSFTVTGTDSLSSTGTRNYSITVGSPCPSLSLTPFLLNATSRTGIFTGLFCVNVFGTGTYSQGAVHGTGTITSAGGVTRITAFGSGLALLGQKTTTTSTFTETAPAPDKAGTFTLT